MFAIKKTTGTGILCENLFVYLESGNLSADTPAS
jgi:hypothetical protein